MANLVLNGKSIDTIDEIAENFIEDEVFAAVCNGTLVAWLEEFGYDEELVKFKAIPSGLDNGTLVSYIIDALGLTEGECLAANRLDKAQKVVNGDANENQKIGHVGPDGNLSKIGNEYGDGAKDDALIDIADEEDVVNDTDIVFDCPNCGRNLCIDYHGAGMQITCSECGADVLVPVPEGMELADLDRSAAELLEQLLVTRHELQRVETQIEEFNSQGKEGGVAVNGKELKDSGMAENGEGTINDTDIVFDCPHCGRSLCIDSHGAGLQIICSECGGAILVPIPDGMTIDDLDLDSGEILKQLIASRCALQHAMARADELSKQRYKSKK